ncbi:MAG: hypothetical protein AB1567_02905 [bacterium]
MESVDNNKEVEVEVLEKDQEYRNPKRRYYLIEWGLKLIFLGIGIFITILLYNKCLFNPNCNPIVTIYFTLLGLTCFLHAGLSIDKLANVKLT